MVIFPHSHLSLPRSPQHPASLVLILSTITLIMTACAGLPLSPTPASSPVPAETLTPTLAPTLTPSPPATPSPTPCTLSPVIVPTLPAEIPGYIELDLSTGLHVTSRFTTPIDLQAYRLEVTGLVDHPLRLSYDELRCMPKVERKVTITCPGVFEDVTMFAGTPLVHILEMAGVQAGAKRVELISADRFSIGVTLEQAYWPENFLAYEWRGEPLPILHGFPLRAVFPGRDGGIWAKWLVRLEVK